jgi:hypothetical protein
MHVIQAFAGRLSAMRSAAEQLGAGYVELPSGLALVPATDALLERPSTIAATVAPFSMLTRDALERWREVVSGDAFGYLETNYWGGVGTQSAAAWRGLETLVEPAMRENAVNDALRALGVVRTFDRDEWDTVGLARFRSTEALIAAAGAR